MKKLIFVMVALAVSATAFAADVNVGKAVLGSGTPSIRNVGGLENATVVDNAKVENNVLHAPQYMPQYPTAATIWPRVVEVPCTKATSGDLNCAGYDWNPAMGRGEYLFVSPKVVEVSKPQVVTVIKEVPGPIREVLVEVPVKKKKE
jgi:hypothetical protein